MDAVAPEKGLLSFTTSPSFDKFQISKLFFLNVVGLSVSVSVDATRQVPKNAGGICSTIDTPTLKTLEATSSHLPRKWGVYGKGGCIQ